MAKKRSATPDVAGYDKQHGPHFDYECTAVSGGANTRLDCDDPFPNNEPDIEVNPANPLNMIVSSNDYGSCCDQYYTTFDGGRTWSTGNMSIEKPLNDYFDRYHTMRMDNFKLADEEIIRGDHGAIIVQPTGARAA